MDTSDYLVPLKADLDFDTLFDQARERVEWDTFEDPLTGKPVEGWWIYRPDSGYACQVAKTIAKQINSTDCRPRFYIQREGTRIPFHTDRGTQCSFNFILTDDPAPIQFKWFAASYKHALLNVQQEHAVFAGRNGPRILFKISVFDKTYYEVRSVLQSLLPPEEQGRISTLFL